MTLTAADVAEIMKLIEQSGFDEIDLEIDGIKLRLRRGGDAQGSAFERESRGVQSAPAPAAPAAVAPRKAAPSTDPDVHDVQSPLLGTFYRSPKPGAPPFVEVGSQVEEDTVVAIVEVMKLMNTVRAGVRGAVTEVLVKDGALAEYGETLLRVRKAG